MEKVIDVADIKTNGNIRASQGVDEQLKASIEKHGLLSPLLVRMEKGKVILVAGHRRLAAVQDLGHKFVSVIEVEGDEQKLLEIQITENLQRKDLSPMEEANAFKALSKLTGGNVTVDHIAQRADKSVAYVTRALSLLTLAEKTQKLIESGELTPEHGHQIARVIGRQRETIEKYANTLQHWQKRYPTIDELKREIEKVVERNLAKAVFPKDVPFYAETTNGACTACPSNTGNQDVLFDGAEKGSCTNGECFNKRSNFWYNEFRDKSGDKLGKLKFVGFASRAGYGMGSETIKGFPIVSTKNTKTAKLLKEHPEKFGFGILKASKWDAAKKPQVVIVSLNKKDKPDGSQAEEKVDYEKDRFVSSHIIKTLCKKAWDERGFIQQKQIIELMVEKVPDELTDILTEAMGVKPPKFYKDLMIQDAAFLLFLSRLQIWHLVPKQWEFVKDSTKMIAAAKKDAAALWEVEKDKAEAK